MEKRYKEIDGVRYQVIQNTILGSNVVPVGESLPEVTVSDSGKVLGVNSSGEWVPVDAPSDLPDVTSADAGDVLTVNASGEWEAAAPGGGGGGGITMLAHVTNTTIIDGYTQVTLDVATSDILTHLSNGGVLIIEYNKAYYHLDFCDLSTPWDEGVSLFRRPYILQEESTGEFYTQNIEYIDYEGSGEEDTYGAWWFYKTERGHVPNVNG